MVADSHGVYSNGIVRVPTGSVLFEASNRKAPFVSSRTELLCNVTFVGIPGAVIDVTNQPDQLNSKPLLRLLSGEACCMYACSSGRCISTLFE